MLDDLFDTLTAFVQSFRRTTPFPIEILVPGLLIILSWPLLRIWLNDPEGAFMAAFVLGIGLRLSLIHIDVYKRQPQGILITTSVTFCTGAASRSQSSPAAPCSTGPPGALTCSAPSTLMN